MGNNWKYVIGIKGLLHFVLLFLKYRIEEGKNNNGKLWEWERWEKSGHR